MDIQKILSRFNRKSFIPSLSSLDMANSSSRLKKYNTASEQLTANIGMVYTANDLIAEKCASVELKLFNKRTDKEVEDDPIFALIQEEPNFTHTSTEIKELYYGYMNLVGEAYLLKAGDNPVKPDALYILPSHQVVYEMGKGGREDNKLRYGEQVYKYDQFMRSIKPDLNNPWVGKGIVAASANILNTDFAAQEFNANFLANQARPSAILSTKQVLEDGAAKRLLQQLKSLYQGSENAGKVMVVEGDSTFTPYMLTQKEMEYLESRKFSLAEILAMFRVSPGMLGMVENVNRSNMEASKVILAENVVIPRVKKFVDFLNMQLIKPYNKDLEIRFTDPTPENMESLVVALDKGYNRWYTRNEARELSGMEAVKGGDEFTVAPVPVAPAPADNSKEIGEIQQSIKTIQAKSNTSEKKKLFDTDAEFEELGALVHGLTIKRLSAFESEFALASRKVFNDIKQDTLRKVKATKKTFKKKKALGDLLPPFDPYKKEYIKVMLPIYETLVKRQGISALTLIAADSNFDIASPQVQLYIERWTKKVAIDVIDETEKQLRATLNEGLKKEETIPSLVARIEETMGLKAQERATKIALTESSRAAGFADIAAWEQSGVVEGKKWYTAEDERVCPSCGAMHGTEVRLKTSFFKDGDPIPNGTNKDGSNRFLTAYGDIDAQPLHPRCRCIMLPITE